MTQPQPKAPSLVSVHSGQGRSAIADQPMNPGHHREPRSQVIFRFTTEAVRRTEFCLRKIASRVVEGYHQAVHVSERTVEFHVGTTVDSLCEAEKANAQLLGRMMKGDARLPVDLEEAWVAALPEPYREECARELVRRQGFLAARPPNDSKGTGVTGVADLAREFAQTVEAVAPILADGRVDAHDRRHIKKALKESNDLMAVLVTLQQQLTSALPEGDQA